jgi:hypothetical protein
MGATNIWTYTLTNDSLTVVASDNAVRLSVICRLGTITVAGSGTFQGIASDPVTLNEGQGVTVTDGVTIDAGTSGDIAEIVISKS